MAGGHRHAESPQQQGRFWGGRARDWAEVQEPFSAPVFEKVLEKAGIGPGTKVLDIGCGAGGFLRMAADGGAIVTGLDASEGLLRVARERTPQGDFRLGDMQHLPFEEGSFDVVTAFNSIQHAPDPGKALTEARRVVRPGGVVAAVVWADEDGDIAQVMEKVRDQLTAGQQDEEHEEQHHHNQQGPFAGSETEALLTLLRAAGLYPGEPEQIRVTIDYPEEKTMLRGMMSPGPLVQAVEKFGEAPVRQALTGAMQAQRLPDGGYRLANRLSIVLSEDKTLAAPGT